MTDDENIQAEDEKPASRPARRKSAISARSLATDSEQSTTRIRKRARRASLEKPSPEQVKRWQRLSLGAVILCLILLALVIFALTRHTTAPVIKNVSFSDISHKQASVTWETDEPTTSQVEICALEVCTSTPLVTSFVSSHSASLGDLKPNTTYRFTLISKDRSGNVAKLVIETTTPAPPSAPFVISGVTAFNITSSSATVTWQTDKPVTGQVQYGETVSLSSATPLDQNSVTDHVFNLSGLRPNTTYYFKVSSRDASGNEVTSEDKTFTTLSGEPTNIEIGPQVGKRAPDFTLPDIDGRQTNLSEFAGKMVILNFWDTSCSACVDEAPYIQGVFDKWSGDNVAVLTISVNQRAPFVKSFVDRRGFTFPVLVDEDGALSAAYQVSSFPTTFFINAEDVIKNINSERFRSQSEIEDIIKSL